MTALPDCTGLGCHLAGDYFYILLKPQTVHLCMVDHEQRGDFGLFDPFLHPIYVKALLRPDRWKNVLSAIKIDVSVEKGGLRGFSENLALRISSEDRGLDGLRSRRQFPRVGMDVVLVSGHRALMAHHPADRIDIRPRIDHRHAVESTGACGT